MMQGLKKMAIIPESFLPSLRPLLLLIK
uniref:Uncharacterized protein n=1 Tax=Anguilla anguilla TaxID=7936 RepID=A0A0E9S0L2_ANGAN